jgi:hypothetical protein
VKHLALSKLAELVDEAYGDPNPCESLDEFRRFLHEDIPSLSLEAIDRERFVARLRWAIDPDSAWLRERLERLDREAARRRR